ncbi:FlgK family flagellar hook-associated protein [Acidocella sp. KAb 2-4]|uniref:FlgK family flagellar hook-associated protein n=1 Tax=Acidocella sp. KAb 2-4 TaxID=2885158 RepID=UPI001D061E0C|nr:flagellar basal body protein [Acidocella sp. KAb 2-4]MCB5945813.1 flagellar basal body protein [Acidocella sp. KAb 2-4]
MSGITSAINTALSGLDLFETGIATVANNISNANTPGYSAETANAATAVGVANQPGSGVQPAQIIRAASGLAAAQLRNANSASAAATAQSTALTNLSNALTNNGDVQSAINQFFGDISTLAANPTSNAQRQTVLSDAQIVTGTFQSAAQNMNTTTATASESLATGVTSANGLLSQLATINKSLGQAPNDPSLLDQQQAALNSLSEFMPISTLPQSNGSVIITTGGTILVDQSGPKALAQTTTSAGTPAITAGTNAVPVTLAEGDGSLGAAIGNIQSGNAALQALNTLAAVFAGKVNTAQAEGLTPAGAQGQPLFSVPAPSVTPGSNNAGSASIAASITNSGALPADGGPFRLTYNATNGWSVTDQASGQSYSASGTPPVIAGMTLAISGTPANGDQFTLNPAPNAATGIGVAAIQTGDIAAADPYVPNTGTLQSDGSIANTNAGTVTTGSDITTATPASNAAVVPAGYYGQPLQIIFTSPSAYTVSVAGGTGSVIASGTLGNNGGNIAVAYPASGAAAGQYWQLPITGTPASGDTLTLTPGGSSSGSNAQRMATLWTTPSTTSSGALEQAFVGLATGLGANAAAAQTLASATSTQVSTATKNLQTVSGVNTDQQAVLLTNYQQAYQAAAQVINAARTMFTSLLQSV